MAHGYAEHNRAKQTRRGRLIRDDLPVGILIINPRLRRGTQKQMIYCSDVDNEYYADAVLRNDKACHR